VGRTGDGEVCLSVPCAAQPSTDTEPYTLQLRIVPLMKILAFSVQYHAFMPSTVRSAHVLVHTPTSAYATSKIDVDLLGANAYYVR